ncbi:MAG TPA: bifunctional diaminohydroxyphosphoribosylaminopyrimidine deaminase/5-amino-6-(5-phosphoribosylamino)uracil reductase RibD, partial [Burkholderiales bacterium]|nr:bifunctional diaminohydroxyphosphoribosylaminopyrimidine deaminase/5-amino-6-(5-phosphoribosylamino)uracil reductase RibD [Burkholderiales bacterium]
MSFTTTDARYMARALALARRGLYTTDPNPRVGCVVVRDEKVVGEGFHERAGQPHAEVIALRAAGDRARGATVYLTLEPCCHHGKTPPCTDALIGAGVARVVAAMSDPNPRVAGKGFAALTQAQITSESGLMQPDSEALNPGFLRRMQQGRPFVRVKLAASLDGRTALANGESKWITGEPARADVQHWRARSSAMLTGIGTVLADDPSLNVRAFEIGRQPLRVVLDSQLRMSPKAKMLALPGTTLVVTASNDAARAAALRQAGAEVQVLADKGRVDLAALMRMLAAREANEILVEAGATLSGALLEAGLVDELVLYQAPCLLGDAGRGLFRLANLTQMAARPALEIKDMRAIGQDWRLV